MRDLLFEIGTEEIPAGFLEAALAQLETRFTTKAAEQKIDHGTIKVMGTPRRLALTVKDVADKQRDIVEELLGPSKKAGIDAQGNYTRAAQGFARSKGAEVEALQVVETPKGEYLMLSREVPGKATMLLLPDLLHSLILEYTFPKSMRWGSNHHAFARPIQWLTALFGEEIISFSHEGISSSNTSSGHRFLANERFTVENVASYEGQLGERYVIVDPAKRRAAVVEEIQKAVAESKSLENAAVAVDEELVDTVTNLVEAPYGVCGMFDEKFLQLPPPVLITSMREHQKYFPVVDGEGHLLPAFVAVNNTRVNDTDITRKGHQRVLRARLEDALFFFNSDRTTKLEARIPHLDSIIFQAKLGTMLDKKERLVKLVRLLAEKTDPALVDDCCRAAALCKADLLSEMVGEFPSLQGTMGGVYARHDGEGDDVGLAIEEHYMPKRADADLPTGDRGAILGLADRFDTLVGCFGIGQVPTGTADPFGLRRISLGILHIIEDRGYSLSLREIIHKALILYGDKVDGSGSTVDGILKFIQGRFSNDCVRRGLNAEAVEAAVSVNFDDVSDCLQRIGALIQLRNDANLGILAASYKRVRNIIKDNADTTVDTALFEHGAEGRLHSLFQTVQVEMRQRIAEGDYVAALEAMLKMKEPVDTFFDEVMVMADDKDLRQNRLNLLTALGDLILQVGDISKLQEG